MVSLGQTTRVTLEYSLETRIMDQARADADDFLRRVREGLIGDKPERVGFFRWDGVSTRSYPVLLAAAALDFPFVRSLRDSVFSHSCNICRAAKGTSTNRSPN